MRFVILHHTGWPERPDHYDLLLQVADGATPDARVLKAFASCADELPAPLRALGERAAKAAAAPAGGRFQAVYVEAARKRAATPNLWIEQPDHRLVYLTYEGEVSDGRGRVTRVLAGEVEFLAVPHPGADEYRFRLTGRHGRAECSLRRQNKDLFRLECPTPPAQGS